MKVLGPGLRRDERCSDYPAIAWASRSPVLIRSAASRSVTNTLIECGSSLFASMVFSASSAKPAAWSRALYAPPLDWSAGWAEAFEQVGSRLWPQFSGLILLEAVKQTFAVKPKAPRLRAKAPVLRPLPVGPVLEPATRFEKRRRSA